MVFQVSLEGNAPMVIKVSLEGNTPMVIKVSLEGNTPSFPNVGLAERQIGGQTIGGNDGAFPSSVRASDWWLNHQWKRRSVGLERVAARGTFHGLVMPEERIHFTLIGPFFRILYKLMADGVVAHIGPLCAVAATFS